jgi:hypothetical protein
MAKLNAKQMRQLLQAISTDPQLKQSKDSILLAKDEYPDVLDAIFTRLTHPTSLYKIQSICSSGTEKQADRMTPN